jgi:hypothetical protein
LSGLQPEHIAGLEAAPPTQPDTAPDASTRDTTEALLRELREAVSARGIASERLAGGLLTTPARVTAGANLMLKRDALEHAPAGVLSALRAAGIDLGATPLPVAIERVNAKLTELTPFVADEMFTRSNVSPVGGQFSPTSELPDLKAVKGHTEP